MHLVDFSKNVSVMFGNHTILLLPPGPSNKMGSVFFIFIFLFWCCQFHGLKTCSLLPADHLLGNVQWAVDKMSDVGFVCLAWLYELFVGTLLSLTKAYCTPAVVDPH